MWKKAPNKLAMAAIIIVFLFFGLKGFVMTVWSAPKSPETYTIHGSDNRSMVMTFLPKHQTMIWYFDPNTDFVEGILTEMKGTYGTHYFWNLWHIEGPGISFGYRLYPGNTEPVVMEMKILKKYISGRKNPTFPDAGATAYSVLLFGKEEVRYEDMWLKKTTSDPQFIDALMSKFEGS